MSYDLIFQQAAAAYNNGDLDKAEMLCRQVLQVVPDNPDVLNMLGLTAQAKNLPDLAAAYFSQALQTAPSHTALCFNLASALACAGKLKEAVIAYQRVLKLNPNIKEVYNNLGGIYEKLKQFETAKEYYHQALQMDSEYSEAAVNLAALQEDIPMLKELKNKYPYSELPAYYLALYFYRHGYFSEALAEISAANKINKNSSEINILFGQINLKLKNKEAAKEKFYEALRLNSKCVEALLALAELQNNEQYYLQALDLEPENLATHAAYANYLYQQKRLTEALEEYRKAVIINPDLPELSNNIALILKDQGDYMQALDLFFNAFMLNPKISEISVNIAETLVLLHYQHPEQALKIAKKWVNTAPDNPFATRTFHAFNGNNKETNNNEYTRVLFDNFAPTYNKTMKNIKYAIWDKIKKLVPPLKGKILDLGCGTGLAGEIFHTPDNTFTGVDISQNMLDVAQLTNAYASLIKEDIIAYLQKNKLKYDFVLALDVVDYICDFNLIPTLLQQTPFLFTIENANDDIPTQKLAPSGRYQHNPLYIEQILRAAGYNNIQKHLITLRQENNQDVAGTVFLATI